MIFSTTTKIKVIGTPVFFFKIRNPVLSSSSKVHGTTMGPGSRGVLESPRKAGILSINRLYLVVIIPVSTGTSHRGVKGLLSIINSDTHMGILFKGARKVITDHKGTLDIITQAIVKLFKFRSVIPGKLCYQGNELGVVVSTGGVFLL